MEQKGIAKKMLPIIKAIADGKIIQFYNGKEWVTETGVNLKEICNDIIEDLTEYRIKLDDEFKPENKLTETQKQSRPFKDCDEMIEHYHEIYKSAVGCDIYFPPLYKPNIWVREKDTERDSLIVEYVPYGVTLGGEINRIGLQELFDNFTFLDGSPCGCWR